MLGCFFFVIFVMSRGGAEGWSDERGTQEAVKRNAVQMRTMPAARNRHSGAKILTVCHAGGLTQCIGIRIPDGRKWSFASLADLLDFA